MCHLEPDTNVRLSGWPHLPLSFLKALSGRLESSNSLRRSGSILYNGHAFDEFSVTRTAAFVEQVWETSVERVWDAWEGLWATHTFVVTLASLRHDEHIHLCRAVRLISTTLS